MASLILSVLFPITIFSLQSITVFANSVAVADSSNLFAGDLLSFIVDQKTTENIVYSPISIYTILALIYMGAGGITSNELRTVLKLNQKQEKEDFALEYGSFLKSMHGKAKSKKRHAPPQLSMANGVYVSKDTRILEQFYKTAHNNFEAKVDNVDFGNNLVAVKKINNWVEQQTANKIKNLIKPGAVNIATSMILVNAIYLRGKWLKPFDTTDTWERDFHLKRDKTVKVITMHKKDSYRYADLKEYNAKAVELQLRDSDISMLIILPNEIDGLKQVEEKLKGKDLNHIVSSMTDKLLNLFLPRFRIESNIDLMEPLKKMGCASMFGNNANFADMFVDGRSHQVSQVKHKAYLECSEEGVEAAGATYGGISNKVGDFRPAITFLADHPFLFAIRNKAAVLFAGHVANFK